MVEQFERELFGIDLVTLTHDPATLCKGSSARQRPKESTRSTNHDRLLGAQHAIDGHRFLRPHQQR